MDKDAFAALLESLCERPFAGTADERTPALDAGAGRAEPSPDAPSPDAPSPDAAEASESAPAAADDPGPATAGLSAILSSTATDAQCRAFQEAAMQSSAVRLEAQSALAFLDGIDAAPIAAPAHLVEQVLAGGAPSRAHPGIWSRLSGDLIGRRAGQVAAACAVMLMAGGLSWSLLWRVDSSRDGAAVPAATSPQAGTSPPAGMSPPAGAPLDSAQPKPVFAPAPSPLLPLPPAASPMPPASPGPVSPLSAPPLAMSPTSPALAPVPEPVPLSPPAQALADPCAPGSFVTQEARSRSKVEAKAAKPAPNPPRTAALATPDPGCSVNGGAVEADRNPQGDQGTVRAARPAARIGRFDRQAPAAASAKRPTPPR